MIGLHKEGLQHWMTPNLVLLITNTTSSCVCARVCACVRRGKKWHQIAYLQPRFVHRGGTLSVVGGGLS